MPVGRHTTLSSSVILLFRLGAGFVFSAFPREAQQLRFDGGQSLDYVPLRIPAEVTVYSGCRPHCDGGPQSDTYVQ